MKKHFIAAALMGAYLFMGATCGTGTVISGPAVVAEIQKLCGILVPIADIAALVSADPDLNSVDLVANAICASFKAQSAKTAPVVPTPVSGTLIVNGVLVHYTK
jgi:hypothetical protein